MQDDRDRITAQLDAAIRMGDPVERSAVLAGTLAELGPGAVGAVRSFVEPLIRDLHPLDAALLIQWWARQDAREALHWLKENPNLYDAALFQRVALAPWAAQDFDAASEFSDNEFPALRQDFLGKVLEKEAI